MNDAVKPRKVFIIAGEPSGDLLGAAVMRAMGRHHAHVTFTGIGGDAMIGEGLTSLFPMDDITAIGFLAVIGKLPLLLRRINEAVAAALAANPDVVVLVDSPDFTLRVAKRIRKARPDIAIVKLVCPTVWAWRPGRARAMKPFVDEVLALFPFEPEVMQRLGGPHCSFIGHPMIERMDEFLPSSSQAVRRLQSPPVILALPGSRTSEISRLAPIFGEALRLLQDRVGPLDIRVPTVPRQAAMMRDAVAQWPVSATVLDAPDDKINAFRQARAAMAASGTVTLELAMADIPLVAAYKVSKIEQKVMEQLVLTPHASLPNIILGEGLVPELLQEAATPAALCDMMVRLIDLDHPLRTSQLAGFKQMRTLMGVGRLHPADAAAARILAYFK